MGVGKTAVCQCLKMKLNNAVLLDGDWCWDAHPFHVNEETKKMVMENVCFVLNRFLRCSVYENVIFCWVMHEQGIIEGILSQLDLSQCEVHTVSLVCSADTLKERLQKDVNDGKRTPDVIERSTERLPLYDVLNTTKISTDGESIFDIADKIIRLNYSSFE